MKFSLIVLTLLNFCSCSMLKPEYLVTMDQNRGMESTKAEPEQYRLEWALNPANKAEMDKFYADEKECKEMAYKAVIAGSRYFESDIWVGCLHRKGYKTNKVAIK